MSTDCGSDDWPLRIRLSVRLLRLVSALPAHEVCPPQTMAEGQHPMMWPRFCILRTSSFQVRVEQEGSGLPTAAGQAHEHKI